MLRTTLGLIGLMLLATGCQNAMQDENLALHRQNRELQEKLTDVESRLRAAPDPAQLQVKDAELAAREAKINQLQMQLQNQLRQPAANVNAPGIEGIETTYDKSAGTMTVNLPGDVLFDSGKETIKDSAKTTLNKIAGALKKDYAGKPIRVEGHTDSDPITKTKDVWEDNLDLSLARAAAVTRYLESQGVAPKQITTSGFGKYRPKGSNKAQNRRVEIVVVVK